METQNINTLQDTLCDELNEYALEYTATADDSMMVTTEEEEMETHVCQDILNGEVTLRILTPQETEQVLRQYHVHVHENLEFDDRTYAYTYQQPDEYPERAAYMPTLISDYRHASYQRVLVALEKPDMDAPISYVQFYVSPAPHIKTHQHVLDAHLSTQVFSKYITIEPLYEDLAEDLYDYNHYMTHDTYTKAAMTILANVWASPHEHLPTVLTILNQRVQHDYASHDAALRETGDVLTQVGLFYQTKYRTANGATLETILDISTTQHT